VLRRWDILSLHDMARDGVSIRDMARITGFSRNTVRKWLRQEQLLTDLGPKKRPGKLEGHKDYVVARMGEGITNAVRILRELRGRGYTGNITILKDFMHPLRPAFPSKATLRYETLPGDQAQVDFGTFSYVTGDTKRRIYAFSMVLSYSRLLYMEFVEKQDLSTLVMCHQRAFEALGGVPRRVLYDNMRTCVAGRDENGQVRWNPRFLDFARLCGFNPNACWPYRAKTKGKVESSIKYLRQSFWPVTFTDLEDLNQQAAAWLNSVANIRIHGTTKERPCDRAKQEQLTPVASRLALGRLLEEERRVSQDGFISHLGARYGVPWQYAGRVVTLRIRDGALEIYLGERRIASHRLVTAGESVQLEGQWRDIPLGPDRPQSKLVGLRVPAPEVQVRSLLAYEAVAGGERT